MYILRPHSWKIMFRDTFSRPPCTLVQPSMQDASVDDAHVPDFGILLTLSHHAYCCIMRTPFDIEHCLLYPAKNFCPPIYPLGDQQWQSNCSDPLIRLYCLQLVPSPSPPTFASRTVIDCRPLMVRIHILLFL